MARYQLKILSPVHIGMGTTLGHIDGYYHQKRWHRIDLDALLASPDIDPNALAVALGERGFRWSEYRRRGANIDLSACTRYSLPCPTDPGESIIREGIRDIFGKPYIPGSSIKGAIRTCLIWHLVDASAASFEWALAAWRNTVASA